VVGSLSIEYISTCWLFHAPYLPHLLMFATEQV
jgi:hypothetical protein